jgi:hypothetical protein
VAKDHLGVKYSCIAWGDSKDKAKSKKNKATQGLGLIALGTNSGVIPVWDLDLGSIAHTLGKESANARVNDVVFGSSQETLYSCNDDKYIFEWQVHTGELTRKIKACKSGADRICMHPRAEMLVVGKDKIKLWDLESNKSEKTLSTNSASAIVSLAFSACGRWLASANAASRFVNLYDTEADSADPVRVFTSDSCPLSLKVHLATSGDAGGKKKKKGGAAETVFVGASTANGGMCVWKHDAGKEGASGSADAGVNTPRPADSVLSGGSGDSNGILDGAFAAGGADAAAPLALRLVRGTPAMASFETAQFLDAHRTPVPEVELAPVPTLAGARAAAKAAKAAEAAEAKAEEAAGSGGGKKARSDVKAVEDVGDSAEVARAADGRASKRARTDSGAEAAEAGAAGQQLSIGDRLAATAAISTALEQRGAGARNALASTRASPASGRALPKVRAWQCWFVGGGCQVFSPGVGACRGGWCVVGVLWGVGFCGLVLVGW